MKTPTAHIAIIVPWFGSLPVYFELFARSVGRNPIVDYHLFTDQEEPDNCKHIPNLIFHPTTFEEYCLRVSNELNIAFRPSRPYKLCDIKPFYIHIHRHEMAEYEFVGFGDIDLILGNLTDFIGGDKQLDRTDFFSAHGNRVSGHFCFMRNNSKFQQIGFKIPNWKAFVCDQRGFGTDEGALCDVVARPLGIARRIWHRTSNSSNSTRDWKLLNLYSKIAHIFLPRRIRFQELHTTHCAISQTILKYKYSESEWIYANGKIIGANNGLEYAYLHFLFLKPGKEEPGNQPWLADFYHVTNPDSDIRINLQGIFNR